MCAVVPLPGLPADGKTAETQQPNLWGFRKLRLFGGPSLEEFGDPHWAAFFMEPTRLSINRNQE